ncbi:MAG TPA: ABC transporter permease, partial [Candidatus Polarisedimenticolia bacterium]|nr:ABC transporter permease [Candidatus Polarisedimenticolia bacterium]
LRSSRVQRKRAVLTIAAIAWGSVSLLLLLAFGEGLRQQMLIARAGMGVNLAVIWAGETSLPYRGLPVGRSIRPKIEDIELIRERAPSVRTVIGELTNWRVSFTNGRKTVNSRVTGTQVAYGDLRNHIAQAGGRFLDVLDETQKRRVVFLGDELAHDLYGDADPVGTSLKLDGTPYTVIGVMQKKLQMGMYGGPDASHAVIPITTYKALYGDDHLDNIVLQPKRADLMPQALREVKEILGAKYGFDPQDERVFGIWDTVKTSANLANILIGIQVFLGVIGGLTLLIGGVGVANIMYAVVKERTREIGVKMALGARPGWITGPLILEGLSYTLVGGVLGLIIAVTLITLLGLIPTEGNKALEFLGKPTLSVPIGLLSALVLGLIGLLAGYFPARRAASVDPAQTLRYE